MHIVSQIKEEMAGCFDFMDSVYSVFGFSFDLKLSTRPEKYLGAVEVWDMAEKVDIIINQLNLNTTCYIFSATLREFG